MLFVIVWCLPIVGLLISNKLGDLQWFGSKKSKGNASIATGVFLEADAVFNPGSRHTIEVVEQQHTHINSDCQTTIHPDEQD